MSWSFSGTHEFRPECVVESIVDEWMLDGIDVTEKAVEISAQVAADIADGRCPRCQGPLPELPEWPAGSRARACRCVPICGRCGADEANQGILSTGLSQFWRWPLRKGDITRRANKVMSMPGVTTSIGIITPSTDGAVVVTEHGVGELKPRPMSGGWAEFGFDEAAS